MRAVRMHRYGGPEVLQNDQVAVPTAKGDQLLVRVRATSVNHMDLSFRAGEPKAVTAWRLPFTPGFDLAGEVETMGPKVTGFEPGDRVFGELGIQGGANAEYVLIRQNRVALLPLSVSWTDAAAIPIAGLTALQALRTHAGLERGQRVLVNGASGGVGAFGVLLAKLFGAHVTAVCSGPKREFVLGLGADEVIDYREEDFTRRDAIWDIVLDASGGGTFADVRRVLSRRGVMIILRINRPNALAMVTSRLQIEPRLVLMVARARSHDLAFLARLVESGRLRVPVERTFVLEELSQAHSQLESGGVRGKVVVEIS